MPKKDKKKKKDKQGSDAADAVEAVRSAVERTFQATSEGAASTQKRTRALVEEIGHAAARVRETLEELKVLEDVRGLRGEIESLARRVAALEGRGAKAAATTSAPARPAAAKPKRRPAKRPAKRASTAKSASPAKRPAKRATTTKRAAKPRAKSAARANAARAKPAKPSSS